MATTDHGDKSQQGRLIPIWVAVVSGLFGVVASVGAAFISTAAGGPITVNVGAPAAEQPGANTSATPSSSATQPTSAATSPSVSPTLSEDPGHAPTYLNSIPAVTGGTSERGVLAISGHPYEQSFKKFCPGSITPQPTSWPVAGYTKLTAVIGVADDEQNALGRVGHITIQNENGVNLIPPLDVSLGKPRTVEISLNGAVQVQLTCAGRDTNGAGGPSLYITMGDAALER